VEPNLIPQADFSYSVQLQMDGTGIRFSNREILTIPFLGSVAFPFSQYVKSGV